MQILMIAENDPAGMGIAFTNAINLYTSHTCRLITFKYKYNFNYQKDLHVPDIRNNDFSEVEDVLKKSDIFHFHMLSDEKMKIGELNVSDYVKGKIILHHHHGHPKFRANPEVFRTKYKNLKRKVIVSTPDLLHMLPESEWIPNIVPINNDLYRPVLERSSEEVVIAQSPTRKNLKNTQEFISAFKLLEQEHKNIVLNIIEHTPHIECLKKKQKADIHFDHIQGYFGVSSLESLSMGKPTIAGIDEWNTDWIKRKTGANMLPWIIARNGDDLYLLLKNLIESKPFREESGKQSRLFMEQYWSEKHIVNHLLEFYNTL